MPLLSAGAPRARARALGIRATSTASGDSEALLDFRHDPVRGVEELRVDLVPAADVADLEQLRRERELRMRAARELLLDRGQDRAEAVLCPDRLRCRRVQPVHELLRGGLVRTLHGGDRRLDLDRRLRDEVVDGLALRLRKLRVAL